MHKTKNLTPTALNVYSPEVIIQNGELVMYCGGWMSQNDSPHDGIYRCVMSDHQTCREWTKVIDAAPLYQINDPVLVQMPLGYWIMYLTGNSSPDPYNPINDTYFCTSWDGVVWSQPQLLIRGYAFPSVTIKYGHVFLYATSVYGSAWVFRFDLGESGVVIDIPVQLSFPESQNYYINIDVAYQPSINLWQMVGENLEGGGMSSHFIDYLYSYDGIQWLLGKNRIITSEMGSVRTPSMHPDCAYYVYYGSSPTRDGMENQICFKEWS